MSLLYMFAYVGTVPTVALGLPGRRDRPHRRALLIFSLVATGARPLRPAGGAAPVPRGRPVRRAGRRRAALGGGRARPLTGEVSPRTASPQVQRVGFRDRVVPRACGSSSRPPRPAARRPARARLAEGERGGQDGLAVDPHAAQAHRAQRAARSRGRRARRTRCWRCSCSVRARWRRAATPREVGRRQAEVGRLGEAGPRPRRRIAWDQPTVLGAVHERVQLVPVERRRPTAHRRPSSRPGRRSRRRALPRRSRCRHRRSGRRRRLGRRARRRASSIDLASALGEPLPDAGAEPLQSPRRGRGIGSSTSGS